MSTTTTDGRYPIGKYIPVSYSEDQKITWLRDIQFLPQDLEIAIQNLDAHQLDTPYRQGGWTVKQVVHHIADSHMNAFIRFKLGVTEENPAIKPYEEKLWADHEDVKSVPVNVSITLLHALHRRWLVFLQSLSANDYNRTVYHPEHKKDLTLWFLLGLYAWHGKHHVAHIIHLKDQKGW